MSKHRQRLTSPSDIRIRDIQGRLTEIIEPRPVHESIREHGTGKGRAHQHVLRSLLEALVIAARPGADTGQASGGKSFESRPAARLEPIVVLRRIDRQAAAWARYLGADKRMSTRAHLSFVKGAAGKAEGDVLNRLDNATMSWWTSARIATGFDPMPITLNEACPICSRRNSMVAHGEGLATTVECKRCETYWTRDQIGILGQMIAANLEKETLAVEPAEQEHEERDEMPPQPIGRGFGVSRAPQLPE